MKLRNPKILSLVVAIILIFLIHFTLYSSNKTTIRKSRNRHLKEKCQAGKIYKITQIQDLFDHSSELQCIFRAAFEPQKVFLGPMLGEIFFVANSRFLNLILRPIWSGKYTNKITCLGKETYMGWNQIFGDALLPFIASLGKISDFVNPLPLYNDNKTSINLDYARDVFEYCPDFPDILKNSPETLPIKRSPSKKNFFIINSVVDVIRPVGMQPDGGVIYLGQMFSKDFFRSDELASPICYFSVVSYDQGVLPGLKSGDSLKPLEKDFFYRNINILDWFLILIPFDNLFQEPIHVLKTFVLGIFNSGRNFSYSLYDLLTGFGSSDREMISQALLSISKGNGSQKISPFISKHEAVHSHYNEL